MTSAAIYGCSGHRLTDDERAFFAEARPWGFILFKRNVKDLKQLFALTHELRESIGRDAPILIDQEGGRVQRMGPPLAAVADHGHALAANDRKVAVAVMEDGQRIG